MSVSKTQRCPRELSNYTQTSDHQDNSTPIVPHTLQLTLVLEIIRSRIWKKMRERRDLILRYLSISNLSNKRHHALDSWCAGKGGLQKYVARGAQVTRLTALRTRNMIFSYVFDYQFRSGICYVNYCCIFF